jgi:hypothetical protein
VAKLARTTADGNRDQIKITVWTDRAVSAADSGRLLIAFDRAFNQFARERTGERDAHLQIIESSSGSWWVILGAAWGVYEVSQEYPDLVPFFNRDLAHVIKILMEQGPEETPKYLQDLARSLGKAGKKMAARVIEIANLDKLELDPAAFELLDAPEPKANLNRQRATSRALPGDQSSMHDQIFEAAARAVEAKLFGTLFKVDGQWFARAEGMHGILVPLTLDSHCASVATHGSAYRIEGAVERTGEGHPIGIAVMRLHKIPPGN